MRKHQVALWAFLALLVLTAGATPPPHLCNGCNFAGQDLADADFSNAIYSGVSFKGANLARASFRDARIIAAEFNGADLRDANLIGAECVACSFSGARLEGATFEGVRLIATDIKHLAATLSDAQVRAVLGGCMACNAGGSAFAGRDLSNLSLISVDFTGADLRKANLRGSVVCWMNGAGTKREPQCDSMRGANLEGADLRDTLVCENPPDRAHCSPVDAETLRRATNSPLAGALLP